MDPTDAGKKSAATGDFAPFLSQFARIFGMGVIAEP
jgi:hypothetical protein